MTARTAEAGLDSVRTVQLAPKHDDPSQLREHIHAPIAFDTPSIDEDAAAGAWQARGSHPSCEFFSVWLFCNNESNGRDTVLPIRFCLMTSDIRAQRVSPARAGRACAASGSSVPDRPTAGRCRCRTASAAGVGRRAKTILLTQSGNCANCGNCQAPLVSAVPAVSAFSQWKRNYNRAGPREPSMGIISR
jgi:hypothetical protein